MASGLREIESIEHCGCGSVLCFGCRSAKAVLLIAADLERIYPDNAAMLQRAANLRGVVNEWLYDTIERVTYDASKHLRGRNNGSS